LRRPDTAAAHGGRTGGDGSGAMAFATLKAALRRSAPGAPGSQARAGDGSGGWPAADGDGADPLDSKPPAPPPKNDAPAPTRRSSRPLPAASLRGPTRRSTAMTHALDERPIKAPGMLALHNIPSSSSLDLASYALPTRLLYCSPGGLGSHAVHLVRAVRTRRRPDGPEAISISKSSLLSTAARLLSWQRSLSPEPDTAAADAGSGPTLDEAGSAHQQRIAEIQAAFVGGQVLASAHRQFVLEGTLVKVCRKANKARRFFLFNDLLVYGTPLPTKRLGNQTILPLSYISIVSLPDEPPGAPASWPHALVARRDADRRIPGHVVSALAQISSTHFRYFRSASRSS